MTSTDTLFACLVVLSFLVVFLLLQLRKLTRRTAAIEQRSIALEAATVQTSQGLNAVLNLVIQTDKETDVRIKNLNETVQELMKDFITIIDLDSQKKKASQNSTN